jgi:hypothetical protein
MRVKRYDLELAFGYVSSGGGGDNSAYLCKETGHIFLHSESGDNFEELPDDIEDAEKYIPIPDQRDLDLGKPLVFRFMREFLADDYDKVREIFSKRGAYARFKDLLEHRRMVDRWHEFENEAQESALREWCARHSIEIVDEP